MEEKHKSYEHYDPTETLSLSEPEEYKYTRKIRIHESAAESHPNYSHYHYWKGESSGQEDGGLVWEFRPEFALLTSGSDSSGGYVHQERFSAMYTDEGSLFRVQVIPDNIFKPELRAKIKPISRAQKYSLDEERISWTIGDILGVGTPFRTWSTESDYQNTHLGLISFLGEDAANDLEKQLKGYLTDTLDYFESYNSLDSPNKDLVFDSIFYEVLSSLLVNITVHKYDNRPINTTDDLYNIFEEELQFSRYSRFSEHRSFLERPSHAIEITLGSFPQGRVDVMNPNHGFPIPEQWRKFPDPIIDSLGDMPLHRFQYDGITYETSQNPEDNRTHIDITNARGKRAQVKILSLIPAEQIRDLMKDDTVQWVMPFLDLYKQTYLNV